MGGSTSVGRGAALLSRRAGRAGAAAFAHWDAVADADFEAGMRELSESVPSVRCGYAGAKAERIRRGRGPLGGRAQ